MDLRNFIRTGLLVFLLVAQPVASYEDDEEQNGAEGITFKMETIDSAVMDIVWADKTVIFVLTEQGSIYRSVDGGQIWKRPQGIDGKVGSIHLSPADSMYTLFLGHNNGGWVTEDMGRTIKRIKLKDAKAKILDLRLHPTKPSSILATKMSSGCGKASKKKLCFKQLFVSEDWGSSWKHCTDFVVQFDWAPTALDPTGKKVYASVHTKTDVNQRFGFWDKDMNFVSTTDYFENTDVLVENGNRFIASDGFFFVAKVNPESPTEVNLGVSRVKESGSVLKFREGVLPVKLGPSSYTVLDTSEKTVFLAVFAESSRGGHIYTSDVSGTIYSMSLPASLRDDDGLCEFDKVQGLEGIYIANYLDEDQQVVDEESEEMSSSEKKHVKHGHREQSKRPQTVISFDKGGTWEHLRPPQRDSEGGKISVCEDCSLHLHGSNALFGPMYSTKTAVGLILATGNVGPHLEEAGNTNTYLSRDGGLNWIEVAKGSHSYEFGDHGGLVVMGKDTEKTDTLIYSWNQGITWEYLRVSNEPIWIENIIIEPSSTAQEFVVYGWKDNEEGVLLYVNFDGLHVHDCEGHDAPNKETSDYETWSPSDGRVEGTCLMGHTIAYTRRKRSSKCFNPEEHERQVLVEHCACTELDFECDYGYERGTPVASDAQVDAESTGAEEDDEAAQEQKADGGIQGGFCVPLAFPPEHDDPHERFLDNGQCVVEVVPTGYRRVAGDTCVGGAPWEPVMKPCAGIGMSFGRIVLVGMACAIGSAIAVLIYKTGFWAFFANLKEKGYRVVGRDVFSGIDSMDDDDQYFDDNYEVENQTMDDEDLQFKPLEQLSRHNPQAVPKLDAPDLSD